jgi:transcriptional regulator with XRE-family HTH domain
VVASHKKGRSGRKAIPLDLEQLRNIPLKQRMTIEDVSSKLGISKSRIQRYLKKGLLRRHSSSIKPYLTDANKKTRLKWCVDMIDQSLVGDPRFKDFFDYVFIDEKWFYLSQKSEKYYLLPEEDEPHRACKNKNYIPRLMFLCVCARPRFRNGECVFMVKLVVFHLSLMNML